MLYLNFSQNFVINMRGWLKRSGMNKKNKKSLDKAQILCYNKDTKEGSKAKPKEV